METMIIKNSKTDLYWSNTFGWTDLNSANRFSFEESLILPLPMEGMWIKESKAK